MLKWRPILSVSEPAVFVAMRTDPTVAGFGSCGPQRAAALIADGFAGEVEAIYVLAADQGRGLGRRLMATMAQALMARGQGSAALWVLRDNRRSRRFYEALGGPWWPSGSRCAARWRSMRLPVAGPIFGSWHPREVGS